MCFFRKLFEDQYENRHILTFERNKLTRLSKNYFFRVPFPDSSWWRDYILVLKAVCRVVGSGRGQWSVPKVWILPMLWTRANKRHCTSTFRLVRSVKRFMRF